MSKSGISKKPNRGSPDSVRETASPVTPQPKDKAVLALKSLLAVPNTPTKTVQSVMETETVDAVSALKAMLARPAPSKQEEPKAQAVQALKSLLLCPVQAEQLSQEATAPAPASFQALKAMLLAPKKEGGVENCSGQKRASSPKTSGGKAKDIKTPPRSKRKKEKSSAASTGRSPAFAGSMFQNSPDPLAVPMPDFDEVQSSFFADDFTEEIPMSTSPVDRADPMSSLRSILKIPAV